MGSKETLDKHIQYVASCETNERELNKKFGRIRSLELLVAIVLGFMYFFNREWASHLLFGVVLWLLITNRNCFFGDLIYSLINLREAKIKHKIVHDKLNEKSD